MNRIVLQVPVSIDLRREAERQALKQGFSSLQDAVRLFLRKLADKALRVTWQEETIKLSPKNERRYSKMTEDFKKGKNVYHARDIDEFLKQLNAS